MQWPGLVCALVVLGVVGKCGDQGVVGVNEALDLGLHGVKILANSHRHGAGGFVLEFQGEAADGIGDGVGGRGDGDAFYGGRGVLGGLRLRHAVERCGSAVVRVSQRTQAGAAGDWGVGAVQCTDLEPLGRARFVAAQNKVVLSA